MSYTGVPSLQTEEQMSQQMAGPGVGNNKLPYVKKDWNKNSDHHHTPSTTASTIHT